MLTEFAVIALIAALTPVAQTAAASSDSAPGFRDYQVSGIFQGQPAPPVLATDEQRRYRTRIRNGVLKGEGVWNGSWKNPIKPSGPNFAGHYLVIRWGCGSNCLMMAIVDARTGKVYNPPLSGAGTELYVPMDMLGDREIEFELRSSLMILRNACKAARSECGVYYFNWRDNRFILVKRKLIDLTQKQ